MVSIIFTSGWAQVGSIFAMSGLRGGGRRVCCPGAKWSAALLSTRPRPDSNINLARSPLKAAGMEEYISMADKLGLKDNKKVRLVNSMIQKDYEKVLAQKDFEKVLAQKDFEKELAQKDFEKERELAQKDFEKEKELAQKDMQHKLSGFESLRRRDLSAISKRFVGDRVLKLTHGILLVY